MSAKLLVAKGNTISSIVLLIMDVANKMINVTKAVIIAAKLAHFVLEAHVFLLLLSYSLLLDLLYLLLE